MSFDLDIAIIVAFLALNLGVGIYYGKGIANIKQYAVGDRNFSTSTIAATIIATWISGSLFTVSISQTYREGVWFIPAAAANIFSLLIISYIFAPRIKEFFGSLSVAESMGKLYGSKIRTVTAICSIAQAIAVTALQIKVFSTVFGHFLHVPSDYATLLSSFVVIAYSAFGGIKSVTFTDVIQYFTFGICIPMFAMFVWQVFGNSESISQEFQTNPLLDFSQLLNVSDPKFLPNFFMFLWFLIPSLNSPMFQRMLMAKNTKQIQLSFGLAAIGYGVIMLFICIIGLLVLAVDSTLDPNSIVVYMVDNYSFTGLRGLTVIGIMAMVMSTADSWINTGAVIFAHDLCKPLGIKFKNELFLARLFSVVVGVCAVLLVLSASSLFKLFSLQANFYLPIITVPLTLAVLGFRTSTLSVSIGMFSGALCVTLWKLYLQSEIGFFEGIDSVVPGMLANLIMLISSHYLLRQKGGWIGGEDDSDLDQVRDERRRYFAPFFDFVCGGWKRFSFVDYCNKFIPRSDATYSYFALSSLLLIFVIFSLKKTVYLEHSYIVNSLYAITSLIGTFFVCNKLLPRNFREKYLGIIWYISVLINLALINCFLVLMSEFSQISLIAFILSISMIGLLLNWQTALISMTVCTACTLYVYQVLLGQQISAETHDTKWQIIYSFFILSGFLIAFLKPKQDYIALSEEKIDDMVHRLDDQKQELYKALELKNEFLRNLQHEAHTPITGITSMAQVLDEAYDKFPEETKRKAIHDIAMSAERLESYVNNLIDLSKLSSMKYDIKLSKVNLSDLVNHKLAKVSKLYIPETSKMDREFIVKVDKSIKIDCDEYYIGRTIENILINAIQYCKKGKIEVTLDKIKAGIEFSVKDNGIGIPPVDLKDVFGAFTTSAKTKTPAGGRGVGLALAKMVLDLHKGQISAESDGHSWTKVSFVL